MDQAEQRAQAKAFLRGMLDRTDEHATAITRALRDKVVAYRRLPYEESQSLTAVEISDMLLSVIEESGPEPRHLEAARLLGEQRARQGIPVEDVIAGYHLAFRYIWHEIFDGARGDTDLLAALARDVSVLWDWTDRISGTMATAHALETRRREESSAARMLELFDGAESGRLNARMYDHARLLGLDPTAPFVVAVTPVEFNDGVSALASRLPRGSVLVSGIRGRRVVAVVQGADPDEVVAAAADISALPALGVGGEHSSLPALAPALREAERALRVSRRQARPASLDADWFVMAVLDERESLRQVLRTGIDVAESHPYLVEAVRAFAGQRSSVAAVARSLHLHINTVRYRLDRWADLTGWDVRVFDGALRSMAAIELAEL